MKRFAAFIVFCVLVAAMFFGFVRPDPTECGNFHPHLDQFGNNPAEVLKAMDWLISSGNFNAWQDGARIVLQFKYAGRLGFGAFGTGNPTFFFPDNGIEYIRQQTNGLNKITSQKSLDQITNHLYSCRNSFARQYQLAEVPVPAQQPAQQPAVNFSLDSLAPLAMTAMLAIIVIGCGALTFGRKLAMG